MSTEQLRMVWPSERLQQPPAIVLPEGYALRICREEDHARFFELMDLAGWPGWDAEKLRPWAARLLREGWFVAVHRASDTTVATAMALHDCAEFGAPGGELGWVAADPAHVGKRLGAAVVAAATAHMLAAGFEHIHLYTEEWRLPALRTYLQLGYLPLLDTPEAPERWRAVCEQVHWPFAPETWRR